MNRSDVRRALWRVMLPAWLVLGLAACPQVEHVPATQILVRIEADNEVLAQTRALRVRTARPRGGEWELRNDARFAAESLKWPVDIAVVPRSEADAVERLEVVVDALGAGDQPLVQARVLTGFVLREMRLLVVRLSGCGERGLGDVCEQDEACLGPTCKACVDARCVDSPFVDPQSLPVFDPLDLDAGHEGGVEPPEAGGDVAVGPEDGGEPPPDCAAGSILDGDVCEDVDECQRGTDDCDDEPEACVNLANGLGFSCACPSGYRGTGKGANGCEDIDECGEQTDSCDSLAMCNNTPGSYSCGDCAPGYTQTSGGACVDINECLTNNGGCDTSPMATCNNVTGGPNTCTCPAGYSGNGVGTSGCTNINDCSPNPCQNGGSCTDGVNAFTCSCTAGFTGTRCELEICGDITIRTAADLTANRACAEIRGNLTLASGATNITATDFPSLTRITGNLAVTTFGAQSGQPMIASLTLDALRTVEGSVQFAGSSTLRVVSLPALTTIGRQGTTPTFQVQQVALGRLEMPVLTTIYGHVNFSQAYGLCSVNLRRVDSVSGNVTLMDLPNIAYTSLNRLIMFASGTKSTTNVGCCTVISSMSCETWSESGIGCDSVTCP